MIAVVCVDVTTNLMMPHVAARFLVTGGLE